MESLLKNLKEHVTCSICLDIFTDPKTITCLHTFCCECLKKHALISQENGKFRCPECQAEVVLPEGNRFAKLPTSFHHNSLLGVLAVRQSDDGSEISCGICKKKRAGISYCFECAKFMCSDCVNAHELFRNTALTEGHKVTPVEQFQAKDYEALMKRQSFCTRQYHEREVTRFFCLKCKTCVCQICIATDHKTHEGHELEPLEKAADRQKANIMARAEIMKEKSKVFSEAIQKLEQTEHELQTNLTITKREVSQAADEMIAKIREREREIITTLENTCVSRAELNSTKTQVQSLLKQINQAVEFAENQVQRSSSSDIMQSKPNLEQRFEDLENTLVPALPVNSFVMFIPTSEPENLTLGYIATSEPVTEGLTQDFQAGVEAEFVIRPGIHREEEYGLKYKFQVLVKPADKVGSLTTCEREDGDFLVKFTPKVPGTFDITVNINGKKLAVSPYTVQVKERLIQVVGELELKGETLKKPRGIAVNSKGLIAIADYEKHCILIFDKEGKFVTKLGCYGNNAGRLNSPTDVIYQNDDNILVADYGNHCIQQFNVNTEKFVKSFGKKGSRDGEFRNPVGLCMDGEGRVIVADLSDNRMQVLSEDGKPVLKFGDSGPGKLDCPTACIYHQDKFFASDWGDHCLRVFDNSVKFLYKIGEPGKGDGQLDGPEQLCLEKCGNHYNLLVCNTYNGRVDQFTVEGCFTGKTVDKLQEPVGITATPDGRILVSDLEARKIYILK